VKDHEGFLLGRFARIPGRLRIRLGRARGRDPVRRQRVRLLLALTAGVAALLGVLLALEQPPSENLTSQIQADLEWRALRGAQELATTSALALFAGDTRSFNQALDAYAASPDIQAIAIEIDGKILLNRGKRALAALVFAAEPGTVIRGDGYVASWAEAASKGTQLGKVAVFVSPRQLEDVQGTRTAIAKHLAIICLAAEALGVLAILWLTRRAPKPAEDAPTSALARPEPLDASPQPSGSTLEEQLDERNHELDDRKRVLGLVLDHSEQGFVMVELGGRMTSDRSATVDRWFGEPAPEVMLADYLSQQSYDIGAPLRRGLEAVCEGVIPLHECLDQMPRQLESGGKVFDLKYAPLLDGDRPQRILLVISNITERVARERAERAAREEKEMSALAELLATNRAEVDEFFAEVAGLVASLDAPADAETERVTVRKLKDSCAYYGLDTYVGLCDRIESSLAQGIVMTDEQRVAIASDWGTIAAQLARRAAEPLGPG